MISLALHERKAHATGNFPAEHYYVDAAHPRYQMPFHWHKEWELIMVRSGKVLFTVDNNEYVTSAGDLLVIPSGCLHAGMPMENSRYECLVFDLSLMCTGSKDMKKSLSPFLQFQIRPLVFYSGKDKKAECFAADSALSACGGLTDTMDDCRQLLATASVAQLFALICCDRSYRAVSEEDRSYARIAQLKYVLEYIELNYGQQISLEALAGLAGLNPGYFCQVFKEMTHRTPIDYLVFYRLEQASIMLSSSEESITDISLKCGFNDSGYFSRRFRLQYNMSPTEYRKKFRI